MNQRKIRKHPKLAGAPGPKEQPILGPALSGGLYGILRLYT